MNQIDRPAGSLQRGDPAQSTPGSASGLFHLRFDAPFLALEDGGPPASLDIAIPAAIRGSDLYLVADIYLADRHAHPSGHAGWWSFAIAGGETVALTIGIKEGHLAVLPRAGHEADHWINPEFTLPPSKTLVMHLVYRQRHNQAIVHSQSLHIYRDVAIAAAAARDRASIGGDVSSVAALPRAPFQWPAGGTIRIVAPGLPPVSRMARGGCAFQLAKLLTREAIDCRLYAASFNPDLRGAVSHIGDLAEDVVEGDLLIVLYDDHLAELPWVCRLPCAKIFCFLGLPESARLQAFDAEAHGQYAKAESAVRHAIGCDIWSAISEGAARTLAHHFMKAVWPGEDSEDAVSPAPTDGDLSARKTMAREILARLTPGDRVRLGGYFDSAARPSADVAAMCEDAVARRIVRCQPAGRGGIWEALAPADLPELPATGPLLLFTGRLSPAEGVVELLELFAEFGKISGDGCLAIAGDHPAPSFLHYVQYLLNTRFAGIKDRVILLGEIEDRALMALFSRAAAVIHLGPSGPGLLGDAVHFRKPLFTACGSSIGTTGGGSGGYRFYGDDRRGQAARLHSLLKDKDALSGLLDLQRQDHEALKSASDCLSIWPLLELAAACVAAP